ESQRRALREGAREPDRAAERSECRADAGCASLDPAAGHDACEHGVLRGTAEPRRDDCRIESHHPGTNSTESRVARLVREPTRTAWARDERGGYNDQRVRRSAW